MRTFDNLHMKPAKNGAALRELVGLQYCLIEDLHRQLERYAEDFSVLLSIINAEVDDDETGSNEKDSGC